MTEKEKYLEWVKREEAKGLVDVNIFGNLKLVGESVTEEDLYREMNAINDAKDRGDYTHYTESLFGKPLEEVRRHARMAGRRLKKRFGKKEGEV